MVATDLFLERLQGVDAGQADGPMMHEHGLSPLPPSEAPIASYKQYFGDLTALDKRGFLC
jgi:hypothetical protein